MEGTGGNRRAWLRCPWAAGPGQATHRHPDRLEAAARPAGPGRASRRRAERSSRRGRRAGGQAARRPEICRGNKPPHTPRRHNKTARPQWGRAAAAVALGFEPRVAVTPHSISSAAPSAARTRYLARIVYYPSPCARKSTGRAGSRATPQPGSRATPPHDHRQRTQHTKQAQPRNLDRLKMRLSDRLGFTPTHKCTTLAEYLFMVAKGFFVSAPNATKQTSLK